jgi:hypothetical protein
MVVFDPVASDPNKGDRTCVPGSELRAERSRSTTSFNYLNNSCQANKIFLVFLNVCVARERTGEHNVEYP